MNYNTFKIVFLGDTSVGKTCIVNQYVSKSFSEFQESTIGAAFISTDIYLEDRTVKLDIWDTAGQERYKSLAPMYYRNASAAFVIFDITNDISFINAKKWIKELDKTANNNLLIYLIGNKSDLESKRRVDYLEAYNYSIENKFRYFETSAKKAYNVDHIFTQIAKDMVNNYSNESNEFTDINLNSIEIINNKKNKKSCCSRS